MAALNALSISLPQQAPEHLPEGIYHAINDLYLQMHNLVQQLNAGAPVMMSPNGHYWVGTISDVGLITWTDVGTVHP